MLTYIVLWVCTKVQSAHQSVSSFPSNDVLIILYLLLIYLFSIFKFSLLLTFNLLVLPVSYTYHRFTFISVCLVMHFIISIFQRFYLNKVDFFFLMLLELQLLEDRSEN